MTWKILPVLALAGALLPAADATTLTVSAGGDLQGTLNAARPGDTVEIAAGAQFVGHFYLPPNPGPGTITIQSSRMSALPGSGTRIAPAQANLMPKLITPDGAPALQMTTGANYYRLQGIEFLAGSGVYTQDVVQIGTGGEPSVGALPHDLDFDRDYIHGDSGVGSKRGVALNGANITIENCYITDLKSQWQDTQAIAGWNGSGPFRIINNHLEGGAETVAFGGAVPAIQGVLPSDILIQRNEFVKPLSWWPGSSSFAGMYVLAKNHIEIKFAQRVTIDNNTFDNNWVGADQRGFVMVFNVRAEGGAVPWAVINNVSVTNNIIRHAAAGMVFVGHDGASNGAGSAGGFLVQNNIFEDINGNWGGDGRLFQVQYGMNGITFDHNTAFEAGYLLVFASGPSYNVNLTNNIVNNGWGLAGEGGSTGSAAIAAFDYGGVVRRNALIGGSANGNPADNFYPGSINAVGFINYLLENFGLSPLSPYFYASTDGSPLGSSIVPAPIPAPIPAPTPTPLVPVSPIPAGWVQIVSVNSGSCVDVVASGGSELRIGTPIQQYTCWGGANQQFQFNPINGGYTITSRASGLQLDVVYGSVSNGTPIIQYPFWGGANETWSLVDAGSGSYTIHPNNSGNCMDVYGRSTANGTPIIQWACTGGANQQYKLVPVQ